MKTNVAFCPHFHQPHFQLQHTREEVFRNSYLPWLELLEGMAGEPGFYINLHFSGPLLLWLAHEKPGYIERLRNLFKRDGIGIIGGLADEAFAQLSARPDDILFQVREYANLTARLLGVNTREWEGLHVVEREAGEWTLYNLAAAARVAGAAPILYLDAETFYESHFNYPGGQYDYCRKHFGFDDPHARTTISHLPPEMLFYGLRDEIGGQEFFVLPVHSQFRYRLLKRRPFGPDDRSIVKPGQYVFYLKDAAEKARALAGRLGKDLEPVIVIFEDAEKFGQWSQDPRGDTLWLQEFFRLVREDEELRFCGLKGYLERQGFLDTYPGATSRSYAEWENWTARRGIRGVTFGDERLRKVIARQRDLERKLHLIDRCLLQGLESQVVSAGVLRDTVLDSPHRFKFIQEVLSARYPEELARAYRVIQRARNLAYQEDPRWASRHPSYGSCGYFDLQGMAYLELAERLADQVLERLSGEPCPLPETVIRDWDLDGEDEIILRTPQQTVVIHVRRGQALLQQALDGQGQEFLELLEYLEREALLPAAYGDILGRSYSLIFTEADSDLREEYYPEGGRAERCRNGFGVEFAILEAGRPARLQQETAGYRLLGIEEVEGGTAVRLEQWTGLSVNGRELRARVSKTFTIREASLHMSLIAQVAEGDCPEGFCLVPELVTSAVPSDERELKPRSWLGLLGEPGEVRWEIDRGPAGGEAETLLLPGPRRLAYVCEIVNGAGRKSVNTVCWEMTSDQSPERVVIEPAVKNYYQGQVFADQSRLGYDSSGLLIRPYVEMVRGRASFEAELSWRLGGGPDQEEFPHVVRLL